MVTWFAGLFYMPRLFVYQIEASEKPSPEKEILGKQLGLMAKRLWKIITAPSLVLCSLFAFLMLHVNPALLQMPWMQIKLGFVILLYIYHGRTWKIFKDLQPEEINCLGANTQDFQTKKCDTSIEELNSLAIAPRFKYTSKQMRLWNEGATLILFAVVFLAITKSATNWLYGLFGLVGLAVLLMLGIKLYKNIQDKNPDA